MISAQELDKGMVMLKMIWSALAGSLILYVIAIPLLLPNTSSNFAVELYNETRMMLYAAAAVTLAVSWLVRRWLLAAKTPLKPSRSRQHPVVQRYTTAMIVALSIAEAIAIYGLVLFLLGKNLTDLLLHSTLALAAMACYFPKKTDLTDLAEKLDRRS
ncbi:MAG: hypothetical protein FWF31_07010 [Desulfobulbus sp.]|nr:hypothetical protein [Desulfobulbus sp.]